MGEKERFSSSCPVYEDQQETNVQKSGQRPNKATAEGKKRHRVPWRKRENGGKKWFRKVNIV